MAILPNKIEISALKPFRAGQIKNSGLLVYPPTFYLVPYSDVLTENLSYKALLDRHLGVPRRIM